MPLASLIGSGMGILNPWNLQIIIENAKVPVLVDAGVGTASDAAIAMELGCAGILMNTAIAGAQNPVLMASAMKKAVEAGREAIVDSTPIIDLLEGLHQERPVRPQDEVHHFLDLLIEDFADEWLTKAMFHYRWSFSQDAKNAGPYIAYGQNPQFERAAANRLSEDFSKRQISRLPLVGSNEWAAAGSVDTDLSFLSFLVRYRDWETDRKSTRLNSSH